MLPLISAGLGLASTIPEIAKLITAAQQAKLADKYASATRPTYTIPEAQQEATTNARVMADGKTLPGQQTMEDKLGANTANATNMAAQKGNPADILATVTALQGNQNDAQNQINTQGVQYQDQNKKELQGQLGQQAAYQDKAFQINQMEPYNNSMKAASALRNASILNEQNGITGLGSAASLGLNAMIPSSGTTDFAGLSSTDQGLAQQYGLTRTQFNQLRAAGKI